jgi:SAM-dependent methyltransferase
MNVFARTSLGVSGSVVRLLGDPEAEDRAAEYICWEVERFSNEDGLLADPTRYERDPAKWRELRLGRDALAATLRAKFILIDDEVAYRARFADRKSILDRSHFGNFHQQHGANLVLNKRVDPARWWIQQKFTPDCLDVRRDSLYGAVQWSFLKDYFARRITSGMHVVDLGCGTGVYTNAMAGHGAMVLGVDPSDEYLAVARRNAAQNARFEVMDVGSANGLDGIASESADMIFMSDALLFYYRQFYPGQNANIQTLLSDVRRILRQGGIFVCLEPHGMFYLNPWLGAADRPFTIVTEYLNKWYGVVPPLAWLFSAFKEAGLAVADMVEIGPAAYFADVDLRGYSFSKEFPLWHLFETLKLK